MTNQLMTTLMWAIAIAHVLTDRILWPFIQSAFDELTADADVPASAPPMLTVAAPPAKEPVTKAPATPRPARRRKSSAKVAA